MGSQRTTFTHRFNSWCGRDSKQRRRRIEIRSPMENTDCRRYGPSPASSIQLKLEVVEGRHITKEKGALFVRSHVESSSGVITMNTNHVPAASYPHWTEALSLECTSINGNLLSQLESHFLVFELRWRTQSLWGDLRGSKRIGRVKIAWRDLLQSKSLAMEDWFPLTVKRGLKDDHKPPALRLALSVTLPTKICQAATGEGNVRMKRMDRDECGCRGHLCNYEGAISSWDAAWGI